MPEGIIRRIINIAVNGGKTGGAVQCASPDVQPASADDKDPVVIDSNTFQSAFKKTSVAMCSENADSYGLLTVADPTDPKNTLWRNVAEEVLKFRTFRAEAEKLGADQMTYAIGEIEKALAGEFQGMKFKDIRAWKGSYWLACKTRSWGHMFKDQIINLRVTHGEVRKILKAAAARPTTGAKECRQTEIEPGMAAAEPLVLAATKGVGFSIDYNYHYADKKASALPAECSYTIKKKISTAPEKSFPAQVKKIDLSQESASTGSAPAGVTRIPVMPISLSIAANVTLNEPGQHSLKLVCKKPGLSLDLGTVTVKQSTIPDREKPKPDKPKPDKPKPDKPKPEPDKPKPEPDKPKPEAKIETPKTKTDPRCVPGPGLKALQNAGECPKP